MSLSSSKGAFSTARINGGLETVIALKPAWNKGSYIGIYINIYISSHSSVVYSLLKFNFSGGLHQSLPVIGFFEFSPLYIFIFIRDTARKLENHTKLFKYNNLQRISNTGKRLDSTQETPNLAQRRDLAL